MFSELQLTDDTDRLSVLEMGLVIERTITIRLKIAYRFVVAEARIVWEVATGPKWVPSRVEAFP
jgi:hypothetical protein